MENQIRVKWEEMRGGKSRPELFYMIADKDSTGWSFFERESYELAWYPVRSTHQLIKRAESELIKQKDLENKNVTLRQVA